MLLPETEKGARRKNVYAVLYIIIKIVSTSEERLAGQKKDLNLEILL